MLFDTSNIDLLAKRDIRLENNYPYNEFTCKKLKINNSSKNIRPETELKINVNIKTKKCIDALNHLKKMMKNERMLNSLNELKKKISNDCSAETKKIQILNSIPENQKELIVTSSPWSKSLKRISSCGNTKKSIEYFGKNYFGGEAQSILIAKNEKSFFTGDDNGNLIQRCILNNKKYNYGQILFSVSDLKHHPNRNDVFLCGRGFKENFGGHQMVQFNLKERKIVKSFGEIQAYSNETPIHSYPQMMAVTPNAQYIYVATTRGFLKKYSIETGYLVQEFGQVFGKISLLKSLKLTDDGKYLLALTQNGKFFKWSVEEGKNLNDYETCLNLRTKFGTDSYSNSELIITKDSKSAYFGINSTIIKLNIATCKIVREIDVSEYGGTVWSLALTKDGKFLFCGTSFLKQEEEISDEMLQEDLEESLTNCSCSSDLSLSSYQIGNENIPKGRLLKFDEKRGVLLKNFGDIHNQAVSKIVVN